MALVYASKDLAPGRRAWVYPLTFGRARLVVGPPDDPSVDDEW